MSHFQPIRNNPFRRRIDALERENLRLRVRIEQLTEDRRRLIRRQVADEREDQQPLWLMANLVGWIVLALIGFSGLLA